MTPFLPVSPPEVSVFLIDYKLLLGLWMYQILSTSLFTLLICIHGAEVKHLSKVTNLNVTSSKSFVNPEIILKYPSCDSFPLSLLDGWVNGMVSCGFDAKSPRASNGSGFRCWDPFIWITGLYPVSFCSLNILSSTSVFHCRSKHQHGLYCQKYLSWFCLIQAGFE